MKDILKYFAVFLLIFSGLGWSMTRPVAMKTGVSMYRSVSELTMKTLFAKTNMYSEAVKMKDGRTSVFRLVMTNDAELQKQIKIAKQKGQSKVDVDGKEFFVDYQMFFLTFWLFLIALILATPLKWKAKIGSLMLSSLLFFIYSLIRLYLLLLQFLSNEVDIGIYQYNDFWSKLIEGVASTQKAGFSALVVFVIWLAFTASKLGWKKRFEKFQKQMSHQNQ